MGQALYRKYRSKSLDDVVGQDHITRTLKNALKSGKISHAYLFTGPRGVGKTSVARILAHEVNSLPYTDESIHLDIIEIDAASNRRIDEIRDLRERVAIAPTSAKYKVYIIDEVHMLTREAFNALLKTLEEPPAHCIFILATTEAHKLPETIISRTQRFEFRPVTAAVVADHLGQMAKTEKLKIDRAALELLAEFGNGSFRDSISYLDQLSSYDKLISEDDVRNLLGLPPAQAIASLLKFTEAGDSAGVLNQLNRIDAQGVNAAATAAALSKGLRAQAASGQIQPWQLNLLKQLVLVSSSSRQSESLEIALLDITSSNDAGTGGGETSKITAAKAQPPKSAAVRVEAKIIKQSTHQSEFNLKLWDEVVERSKKQAASIYTALRLAKPSYSDGVLVLAFQFPLHQKKLAQTKNKAMISEIISQISGSAVAIEPIVERPDEAHKTPDHEVDFSSVNSISNIFGNAEVIEA